MVVIINNPGPITTCHVDHNPANTKNRVSMRVAGSEHVILGWITRLPWWSEDTWHVSACQEGRVHLIAYVQDPQQVWPTLYKWWEDRKREQDEARDGV